INADFVLQSLHSFPTRRSSDLIVIHVFNLTVFHSSENTWFEKTLFRKASNTNKVLTESNVNRDTSFFPKSNDFFNKIRGEDITSFFFMCSFCFKQSIQCWVLLFVEIYFFSTDFFYKIRG